MIHTRFYRGTICKWFNLKLTNIILAVRLAAKNIPDIFYWALKFRAIFSFKHE